MPKISTATESLYKYLFANGQQPIRWMSDTAAGTTAGENDQAEGAALSILSFFHSARGTILNLFREFIRMVLYIYFPLLLK
jgi:hypothetical protein